MSTPIAVTVSPLAAHFLLRTRAEQVIIAGTALLAAAPFLAMTAVAAWSTGVGGATITTALVAVVCGKVGWWLGTKPANLLALARHRRAMKAAGQL